jgi:aminopeptidase N
MPSAPNGDPVRNGSTEAFRAATDTMPGRIVELAFTQSDPRRRGLQWDQRIDVTLGYPTGDTVVQVRLAGQRARVREAAGLPSPLYVLPNGNGIAYGQIELDAASRRYLLEHLEEISNSLTRGSAWVTLWDELLRGSLDAPGFLELAMRALPLESDELNAQQILSYVEGAYWRFIDEASRLAYAPRLESVLWTQLLAAPTQSLKSSYFRAYRDLAMTPEGVARLHRVWRRDEKVPGLTFSEVDEIAMALEIAVRGVQGWQEVLDEQFGRIQNPDRKSRFAFVRPALDADPVVRARFFESLADARNRGHEPWVTEGVAYLNHPLRAAASVRFIAPSLRLLRELQRTGDIFFPKNWMDATLSGHSSPAAARTVRQFLATLPASYPARLRMTIEASGDMLFRAAAVPRQQRSSSTAPRRSVR